MKLKQWDEKQFLTYVETKIEKVQFRMIVGWVYPESLKELGEVNRYAEALLKSKHVGASYQQQTYGYSYFVHVYS